MVQGQRVLIVDGMHEIQEVLETVLSPRGLRVDWMRSQVQSVPAENQGQPDLLVIDAEACPISADGVNRVWNDVPQVILGSRQTAVESNAPHGPQAHLAKPFQFPDLIREIERLLPKTVASAAK